ncbi:hypothetical protein Tco_0688120, partial [Tanacetum coccineum]
GGRVMAAGGGRPRWCRGDEGGGGSGVE